MAKGGIVVIALGVTIKRLRTERGWKQRELARRAGIAQSLISTMESGARDNPTQDTVTKLATVFDLTVPQFLAEVQGPPAPDTTRPPEDLFRAVYPPERVARILQLWDQLSIKMRLELIAIAEDMKRRIEEGTQRTETLLQHQPAMVGAALEK